MKRIALLFALCLLTLVGASWADTPAFIDESTYPTFNHPLTAAEQAHLGLSAKFLREPLEVLNRVGPSNYKFDRLEPGDVVLVDKDGTPRYKASCGNRIETLPIKVTVIAPPTPVAPIVAATPVVASGTNWGEFFKTLGAILLAALLITAALMLIIWALQGVLRRRTTTPVVTPSPDPTSPTPHVTPLVSPAPEPVSLAPSATPTSAVPILGAVSPAPAATPSSLTRHTHPMYLWTVRNGNVEWDTALVAATIESGFGPDGNATLGIRLTARPPVPVP